MKYKTKIFLGLMAFSISSFADDSIIVDRLLSCIDENHSKNREIDSLRYELVNCQNSKPVIWSCVAGCEGSGNIGIGTGSSEGEAKAAALKDLKLICSHHTFDCSSN